MVDKWVISFICTLKTNTFFFIKYLKLCLKRRFLVLTNREKTLTNREKTLTNREKMLTNRGKRATNKEKMLTRWFNATKFNLVIVDFNIININSFII